MLIAEDKNGDVMYVALYNQIERETRFKEL